MNGMQTAQTKSQDNRFEKLFHELYLSQRQALYSFLLKKLDGNGVAEDILHDVFLKFWLARDSYDSIENHKGFLFKMAFNAVIDYYDRQKNLRLFYKTVSANKHGCFNSTDEIIYQKELEILLQKTIDQLSPRRKQVYVLCKLQGLSHRNVASILDVSAITVKNTMRLANEMIRKTVNNWNETSRKEKAVKIKV